MTDSLSLPDLILGSRNQLHWLMFDDRTRQYVAIDERTLFDLDRYSQYTVSIQLSAVSHQLKTPIGLIT